MTEWIMIVITGIYVIATIFISFFNYQSSKAARQMFEESRRQFDELNKPYITTEITYKRRQLYCLTIANHGRRIATRMRVSFDQAFLESMPEANYREQLLSQEGLEFNLGVGGKRNLFLGTNDFRNKSEHVLPIAGEIVYCDGDGKIRELFSIDFSKYATFFSTTGKTERMEKKIKTISDNIGRIAKTLEDQRRN